MRHLGPPPREADPGLQKLLVADYARRAGIAAGYREAAGITDPHQVIRWDGHKGNPELEAMRHDAISALQIHDEQADLAGMDRGQLEAKVIAGARARAAAPRDVSADLRVTAQAETDMRIMAGQAQVGGADPAVYDQAAAELAARREGWEADNATYETWSDSTAGTRDIAGKAQAELERRGHNVPAWAPEDEHSEPGQTSPSARRTLNRSRRPSLRRASPRRARRQPKTQGPGLRPSPRRLTWCNGGSLAAWKVNTTTGIPFSRALSTVSWVPLLALI